MTRLFNWILDKLHIGNWCRSHIHLTLLFTFILYFLWGYPLIFIYYVLGYWVTVFLVIVLSFVLVAAVWWGCTEKGRLALRWSIPVLIPLGLSGVGMMGGGFWRITVAPIAGIPWVMGNIAGIPLIISLILLLLPNRKKGEDANDN